MTKEVKLNAEIRAVERVIKKDGDEVVSSIGKIIKKLFLGVDFEVLEKKVEELKIKEKNNLLGDEDRKQLPKLLAVFENKKTEIERKVDQLFAKIVDSTTTHSASQIKSEAVLLLDEVGDSGAIVGARRDKLAQVVVEGLYSAKKIQSGMKSGSQPTLDDKKEAAEWMKRVEKSKEVKNSYNREPKLVSLRDVVVKSSDNLDKMSVDELSEALRLESEQKNQRGTPTKDLLQLGDTNRDAVKRGMSPRSAQLVDKISRSGFEDDPIYKTITSGQVLSMKEKRFIQKFGGQLNTLEEELRDAEWTIAIDGVNTLNLGRWGSTDFVISGIVVDKSVGGLKHRLQDAFKLIDFDVDEADSALVDRQKLLLRATGITQDEADQIWSNVRAWRDENGKFVKGVDQLRLETTMAVNKRARQDNSELPVDVGAAADQMEWAKLINGRDANDNPIYTAEGKRRLQQLDGVIVDFVEDGEDADGNKLWKIRSFNRFEDYVEKELKANYKSVFSENQQKALGEMEEEIARQLEMRKGDPESIKEYLKDEIEKQIMTIYGTGDASRAPGNQMASYRLYSLMGHLSGESDFKTMWMARLAIYDVKMFMSGVEGYEEWAKVNSFLPIEFREYLHHDEMVIGNIIDQNGNVKELKFNFADIYTMYEEQDGAVNGDERDVWIARILAGGKTKNMDGFSLSKRQAMAAYLGKQLGIKFQFEQQGGQEHFRQIGNEKITLGGKEVSLLSLVGLDDNGGVLPADLQNANDLFSQYNWYMDMPIDMGHLELRWVGIERGGNNGDWWAFGINGLRKLHGLAQVEYHKRKGMSLESAVDEMDSGWRSFLAWKLFETHKGSDVKVFWQPVEKILDQGGVTGKKKEFFEFMKQVVYLPEYWKNGTVCGELRTIAEIRNLNGNELNKVLQMYQKFDASGQYNWADILKKMGMEVPNGANTIGVAGMHLLLQNFNLHRLISYDAIPHNLVADAIKYTGYAEGFWKASVKAGDYIWDTGVQYELVSAIKGYHGKKGGEWKANQLFNRQVLKGAMSSWEGQETYMDEKGNEAAVLWKPKQSEMADVLKRGWRVDKDGYVLDENNVYRYRPGKIGYWDGFMDPNKHWAKGSAAARHGNAVTNWKTTKEILKGYLKSRMVTPEQYSIMSKRFKYKMYFDADIEWNEEPTIKMVLETFRKKPWKLLTLPYNILRGLAVDLGLEKEDWVSFFAPFGKAVGGELSKIGK